MNSVDWLGLLWGQSKATLEKLFLASEASSGSLKDRISHSWGMLGGLPVGSLQFIRIAPYGHRVRVRVRVRVSVRVRVRGRVRVRVRVRVSVRVCVRVCVRVSVARLGGALRSGDA